MPEIITPPLTEIEFRTQFRKRLEELQEWGIKNGYYISAYLDLEASGAYPKIGYRPLSQTEKQQSSHIIK